MKTIIIGGVAGGASTAARLRRHGREGGDRAAGAGPHISYANCGLPYHLGKIIPERDWLLVMTPADFRARFNVDVRVNHEAVAIDRAKKTVKVLNRQTGVESEERYDKLVIATGSSPMQLKLPGIDLPEVLPLWTLEDMDRIAKKLDAGAKSVVVVGRRVRGDGTGGEPAAPRAGGDAAGDGAAASADDGRGDELAAGGGAAAGGDRGGTGRGGVGLRARGGRRRARDRERRPVLDGGRRGAVRGGEAQLGAGGGGGAGGGAERAHCDRCAHAHGRSGCVCAGRRGVGDRPGIWRSRRRCRWRGRRTGRGASWRTTCWAATALRGDLRRVGGEGRQADGGELRPHRGAAEGDGQGVSKVYLHAGSHAGYYPGATPLHIKLLFGDDGKIYGGQVIGAEGADKRADVLATAMRAGMDVRQLAELELCYAPPFSSAKDPITVAGMIATNALDGTTTLAHADALPAGALLLDVREPAELAQGALKGAVNIPLHKLRARAFELPKDRQIVIFCQVGLRGYVAERILKQLGYDAANLSGGYLTWKQFQPEKWIPSDDEIALSTTGSEGGPRLEARTASRPWWWTCARCNVPARWCASRRNWTRWASGRR
jgi:NADPH-dependent 2,4-dienoyl-CoA reductase/sulfur reductase-like enzyme/rhodanese-related sulfurtransferase